MKTTARIRVATALAARSLGLHVDELPSSATGDAFAPVAVPELTPVWVLLALQLVPAACEARDLDDALGSSVVRRATSLLAAAVYVDESRRRRMVVEAWREARAFVEATAHVVEALASRLEREPLPARELPRVAWPTLATSN